jgi:U3 small nucleolar RNA-associated protein 22
MDQGPSADDKTNAPVFRAFWGDKSQLRRFQDGTILEAVLWDVRPGHEYSVPGAIVAYALRKHLLPAASQDLVVNPPQHPLEAFLHRRPAHDAPPAAGSAKESAAALSMSALTALKELEKALEDMPELPLRIKDVWAASNTLAATEPFPPLPSTPLPVIGKEVSAAPMQPIELVFAFSTSSKWPDNLNAIARVKTAFYLKIGALLMNKFAFPTTVTAYYVDVCVQKFAFRLRLHHPREIALFRDGATQAAPLVTADGFFRTVERRLVHRPAHIQFVRGLTAQYPLLAPTIRLVRRWVHAHLFGGVLSEEAVDLVAAHVFVAPQPYTVPASLLTAFTRVLDLLAFYNWRAQPLIVPSIQLSSEAKTGTALTLDSVQFENDLPRELVVEIHAKFQQRRKSGKGAAMYIATAHDLESRVWTMRAGTNEDVDTGDNKSLKLVSAPSAADLDRITSYARATLQGLAALVRAQDSKFASWVSLFKTPLELFDGFLQLDVQALGRERAGQSLFLLAPKHEEAAAAAAATPRRGKGGYKLPADMDANATSAPEEVDASLPVHAGYDPVRRLLEELRRCFGHLASFYHDALGGRVIAVKFHADPEAPSEDAAVLLGKQPVSEDPARLRGNKLDLLDQMGVLGEGVVAHIFSSYADFAEAIRY